MFLRPRMTRTGGHAGPYVWGGVTGVTNSDNPWLTAVQENTATRLVVSANSYDAEQRFLVNENPLSVRTALGVGFGTAGIAGPVFAPDKYGPAMWVDQSLGAALMSCTVPALTSASVFTLQGHVRCDTDRGASQYLARIGSANIYLGVSGLIAVWDGSSTDAASSNVKTLLGIDDWEPFHWRLHANGTTLNVDVSSDGASWVSAISGATISAISPGGATLYVGASNTSSGFRGSYYSLSVRDGGTGASKVAEFLPSMFVGGNRADGDTAVDAYGVTWTVERPAATTDMPRVMVGRTEQYISLPGVAGEYVSTPATAANKITGDFSIKMKVTPDDYTPASTGGFANRWSGASDRSWRCQLFTAGTVLFQHTSDGATTKSAYSTADFTGSYLGVYLDVDNGAGGHDVYFYTSSDGVTWTQLGSTVTTAGTSSVYAGTSALIVGGHNSGASELMPMDFEWMELISGDLNGTLVERIDAAEADPNATTWTSSTSGATVTVNKSASSQYHATVVPAGTTIVQGDGVNDFAQVCGDDTVGNVAAAGVTLVLDYKVDSGAGAWAAFASSGDAGGLTIRRWSTLPRTYGYPNDGTNQPLLGEAADNITYGQRAMFALAVANGDQEGYVDGASVDTATSALTDARALGSLTFGSFPDRTAPAAFDLYGVAVLGERTSDTEAAAYATEGLTR